MKTNGREINKRAMSDNLTTWNERLLEKSWGRICILDILEDRNHTTEVDCKQYKNCEECIAIWINRKAE